MRPVVDPFKIPRIRVEASRTPAPDVWIVHLQHLRRMRKHIPQLAHNPIRRNHRLVRLQSISRSFVDVQHTR